MSPSRSPLRALASRMGILDGYTSQDGKPRRTSDDTRVALLRAMHIDASTPVLAREALDALGGLPGGTSEVRMEAPCPPAEQLLRGRRVWGVTANLYSVRSASNWGFGNTGDLQHLLRWTAERGGAFVGLNPLHAIRNRGDEISPYGPISRLYRNPLYIDVTRVPEWEAVRDEAAERDAQRLRDSSQVDYDRVRELVIPMLRRLHAAFLEGARGVRKESYLSYCREQGESLDLFAAFAAIEDDLRVRAGHAAGWRDWPAAMRDARGAAVKAFVQTRERDVDFYRWTQFELDRQLGEVAHAARTLGMPVGLYQDLAIGTPGDAADVWSRPGLFAQGVSIGAPPDPYAATGQIWGLVPMNPHRMVHEDRLGYWRDLVRASLRHSGAIRIDHVLGLFRQFWVPDGGSGKDGAYVRFPLDAMLGVLADEARRGEAIVVGEDLGTVPPEVPSTLARWNILSSKVMYFEWSPKRGFRAPRAYPRQALATANTHDHAPIAGYWRGRDIEMRETLGTLPGRAASAARASRKRERADMLRALRAEGLLGDDEPDTEQLVEAVHAFVRRTPCWLVGLSLDDLAMEEVGVNVPGVPISRHRSWSRRLRQPLETMLSDPRTVRLLGDERRW